MKMASYQNLLLLLKSMNSNAQIMMIMMLTLPFDIAAQQFHCRCKAAGNLPTNLHRWQVLEYPSKV